MNKRIGVYICTGCGIGEAINIEKLSNVAIGEFNVPVCKTHHCLCGQEGVAIITKDCQENGINTIVIAGCSPRVNQDVFAFNTDKIMERVTLREHVVWSQAANNEDTQMMAEDYLRMGIVKAQKTALLEPYKPVEEISKTILVVGGGISGMTAAIEAAKANSQVVLVEKEQTLGGFAARLYNLSSGKIFISTCIS